jgi:RNA polymerase-binding transcription factor DksA
MASKKPAPKKAPAKKAAKPTPKKAAPAKKAAKPAPKKAAPAKKPVKPAPKKAAAPAANAKKTAKPAPKKVVAPVKNAAAKPAPAPKAPVKKAPAPPPAKSVKPPVKAAVPAKPAAKPAPAPVKAAPLPPMPVKPVKTGPPPAPAKAVKKAQEPIKEVKVPKIATKTSVPYRPGYTQLEKRIDTVRSNNGEPLVKYNDNDLAEFRELITKKLEAAKKELAYLQGLITRKDEMGGDNDDARYMTMEDGSMSMEREQLSQMASRQITYIDHLEKALMRIENKTYGICRVTGKLIDKARLRAVPHATLSLEAKLGLVRPSTEQ